MDKRTLRKINIPMRYCIICGQSIIRNTKQGEKRIATTQYRKVKFCSLECKGKWWSKKQTKNNTNYQQGRPKCKDCDKELSYTRKRNRNNRRCKECWKKYIHDNPFARGCPPPNNRPKSNKRYDKSGYVLIYSPKHPYKNIGNYVREHRLVAEKCLNRYLTKTEVIHHINGKKNDNRPENLYLFPNHSKHISWHLMANRKKLISNLIT